jgi:uncharacterized protein YdaT
MTDRKSVTDLSSPLLSGGYDSIPIEKAIEWLQQKQSEGFTKLETETERAQFPGESDHVTVVASKTRLENDEEFEARVAQQLEMRERRRRLFDSLKEEFA